MPGRTPAPYSPGVCVMLANMQVTLMMAKRIDHIQCFLVRPDDLRLAKGNPDVSRMDIHVGASYCAKIFGVVLCIGGLYSHMHAHPIRRRGRSISPGSRERSGEHKVIQI